MLVLMLGGAMLYHTKLVQTLIGHPIQFHRVIVVLGKEVGLGYALAQCTDPWYICPYDSYRFLYGLAYMPTYLFIE
jgi:hypothetical protein